MVGWLLLVGLDSIASAVESSRQAANKRAGRILSSIHWR